MAGRWSLSRGDFFSSVPAGDFCLLKRILHDWDDDESATILRNCRQAMAPGGRVLVIDAVVWSGNRPHQSKAVDPMMMAPSREGAHGRGLRTALRGGRAAPAANRADADRTVRGRGGERPVGPEATPSRENLDARPFGTGNPGETSRRPHRIYKA
ncbi:methyltransferase [Streptomyces sp. NPDC047917]|uniref:methyltransferase n=1 Tax=Streptomyces sp. NPDC047917 TaxID=3365491 RepID=UPI00371BF121